MSFYGGTYPVYPPSIYQPNGYTPMHSSLAGYGGTYRVNQPSYYTGPSYSTTSDNDYPWFNSAAAVPPPPPPQSGFSYASGYSSGGGYNGYSSNYFSNEPYPYTNTSYTPHYTGSYQQQQVVSAMPTSSGQHRNYHQQQQHSSSSRSHSGTGSQANLNRGGGSSSVGGGGGGGGGGSDSQSEDLTQLEPQIEAAYEAATGQRRQSVIKRQVITIPGQPGRVQQVVRRLPTPTPDVIERVFIVKPQRDTVNLIIERPSTPPAQYKDKTVYGKQRRPLINPKIIQVPSRQNTPGMPIGTLSSYYPYYSQQQYPAYNNMQALQHQASTSSSYQFQPQHPAMSQVSTNQQQQQQYATQPTMSQGNSSHHSNSQSQSQSQLSDASHTRLSDRLSQHQLNQPQQQTSSSTQQQPKIKGAYLVAPVKYEESSIQQQQQQQQTPPPLSYMMPTSPLSYPNYAGYSSNGYGSYYPSAYPTTPYGTRIY
jgi:hypothetical protein